MKNTRILVAVLALVTASVADDLQLSWDAAPENEQVTSYNVYEKTGPSDVLVASVDAIGNTDPAVSCTLTNVVPGAHTYYVKSANFWGEGPASDNLTVPPTATKVNNVRITR